MSRYARRFTRTLLLAVSVLLLWALAPSGVSAQTAEVSAEQANFRLDPEPQGTLLATLNRGTRVEVTGEEGRWREVVLTGWIWNASISRTDRDGFDLEVTVSGGENLRDEPDAGARVAARLQRGMLLERLEERESWTRVRRTAWIWEPAVREVDVGSAGEPAEGGAEEARRERWVVERGPVRLHRSPEGAEAAELGEGTDLAVLERRGDWARVRLEGWVRAGELVTADELEEGLELTVSDLRSEPEAHVDRQLRWTLQFISLERAEPERTDFYEGEPFLLTRTVESPQAFVYVAVPRDMMPRAERLRPLQYVEVVGRVRTGRSALMGAPILDLVDLIPMER